MKMLKEKNKMKSKPITLSKINEIAEDVISSTYEELTESSIRETMMDIVSDKKEKMILESLGLHKTWGGGYEVDRYAISQLKLLSADELNKLAKEVFSQIFNESGGKIVLSREQIRLLKKELTDSYCLELRKRIRERAEEQAGIDVGHYFEEFMKAQGQKEETEDEHTSD